MPDDTIRWMNAFFELFVVLAFALGWLVLEYVGRRLDRKREIESAAAKEALERSESKSSKSAADDATPS